jgi:hypothetical protein
MRDKVLKMSRRKRRRLADALSGMGEATRLIGESPCPLGTRRDTGEQGTRCEETRVDWWLDCFMGGIE